MNQQLSLTDDLDDSGPKKAAASPKVQRGNLGFCPLDMSLLNLCGIPSLWMDPKEFSTGCNKIIVDSYHSQQKIIQEQFIKPYQRKLFQKQYKVYELLRFHKIFESEKYFGKSINQIQNVFQDYYYFSAELLKDNAKYQVGKLQEGWDDQFKTGNNSWQNQ